MERLRTHLDVSTVDSISRWEESWLVRPSARSWNCCHPDSLGGDHRFDPQVLGHHCVLDAADEAGQVVRETGESHPATFLSSNEPQGSVPIS